MTETGIVFNVQRFTIHDGPGMRTEFFLKGCPLRCQWCSNPESWAPQPQVGVYRTKCIGRKVCGGCEDSCPEGDIFRFTAGKLAGIDRTKCTDCLACYEECPSDALKQWGRQMTVEECMELIRRDQGYYERSGGGVTVSGGDPLVQSDFVEALFRACKAEGYHTCCESTFCASWSEVEKVLPYTDLIISDLKLMDSALHRQYTGVGNELILQNLRRLAQEGRELILRIPVIPGVNDGRQNIEASAVLSSDSWAGRCDPAAFEFMRLGRGKIQITGDPVPDGSRAPAAPSVPAAGRRNCKVFQQPGHPLPRGHQRKRRESTGINHHTKEEHPWQLSTPPHAAPSRTIKFTAWAIRSTTRIGRPTPASTSCARLFWTVVMMWM